MTGMKTIGPNSNSLQRKPRSKVIKYFVRILLHQSAVRYKENITVRTENEK